MASIVIHARGDQPRGDITRYEAVQYANPAFTGIEIGVSKEMISVFIAPNDEKSWAYLLTQLALRLDSDAVRIALQSTAT